MKNIKIIYILSFLNRLWFWLGVWIFYYLLFTDYAGIGLIESVMIFSLMIMEVPSGAIADLLGKKKVIFLSFFFLAVGNAMLAFAPNYYFILLSVFILSISAAFYSGSGEALVFDSLKVKNKEALFEKVISNIKTIQLVALAVAGAVGGFMYDISHSLPFLAVSTAGLLGMIFSMFLKEPKVDTEIFSLKNFIEQNKQGLKQLFTSKQIKQQTIILLSISFVLVISYEMLNDALAVEFGYNQKQLGILWSVLALLAAASSQITPRLNSKYGLKKIYIIFGGTIAASLFLSPLAGLIVGGVLIAIRVMSQAVFENLTSIIVNNNTESKYRATTLSAFSFIKNIPYVFVAYFMGRIMDIYSARVFAAGLGLFLLVLLVIFGRRTKFA